MTLKELAALPDTLDIGVRYDDKLANYVLRERLCTNRENTLWGLRNPAYSKR